MSPTHAKTLQRRRERDLLDDVPRCSKCGGPNRRTRQRYCAGCHTEYMKEWRGKHLFVSRETFLRAINEPPIFVYIISEAGDEYCKIGVAGSPEDRLQLLRPGNGRELTVFKAWQIPSRSEAFGIERIILHTFRRAVGNGEWIKVSPNDIAAFLEGFMRPPSESLPPSAQERAA